MAAEYDKNLEGPRSQVVGPGIHPYYDYKA
jgi:hypothetical protein